MFTNDEMAKDKLAKFLQEDFGDELLVQGSECLYLYLPRDTKKKHLYTNYLEKRLGDRMNARKLSVVERLTEM